MEISTPAPEPPRGTRFHPGPRTLLPPTRRASTLLVAIVVVLGWALLLILWQSKAPGALAINALLSDSEKAMRSAITNRNFPEGTNVSPNAKALLMRVSDPNVSRWAFRMASYPDDLNDDDPKSVTTTVVLIKDARSAKFVLHWEKDHDEYRLDSVDVVG